jgi:hypothetical protein
MTATAAAGFVFRNWTGSLTTTDNPLTFMMRPNLSFTANFVDTNKPVLVITSPTAGQRWSNAVFSVTGTARDNVQVTSVLYQLNGAGWHPGTTGNGWSNWTAAVNPAPGTNLLRAYAVDAAGNRSPTNSVSFVYVASDTLRVRATGQGTLTPNYSNAVLEIGRSYSMTARAASGHAFANWMISTNWLGGLTTNNATVRFVMQSNLTLQVNFVDTNKPVLVIASPTAGQRWSNAVFSVTGTARDNVQVTSVLYQLNGAAWHPGTTGNSWSNWTAAVNLTPGTNLVRAYAVDAAGNRSPTNSVSFVYVLSDTLRVRATGQGTLTPNYSNAWLEIGKSYAMTATAGRGFGFVNWTAGLGGAVVTNKATVRFVMQSNLVLVANFVDVQKPTLMITAPTAGQRVSNTVAQVTVKGRASDNVAVSDVLYQLNGAVWAPAGTTSGWTNWTATLVPSAGTNVVKACAVDTSGNRSLTNGVSFFYVVPSPLTLLTNGVGTITRNFTGSTLEVGRSYTVTGVPGAGQVFSNWVGSVTSSSAALSFLMQPNMVLQANFIPNPFLRAKGTYNGLFAEAGRAQESSGFFTLALTDKGAYSGSLRRGTSSYSLSGQFDVAGWASKTVLRPGTNSWALTMWLDLAGAEALTGTVGDGHWLAVLRADRAVFNAQTNPATLYAGKYTLIVPGSTDASASPGGEGYGTVVVNGAGQVTLSGSLADGSALSQSVPVSRDGRWPLYASLYTGKGSVWSWLAFDAYNNPARGLEGDLSWIKPAQLGVRYYPAGFTNEVVAEGSRYTQPAGLTNRVIHLTNGVVSFEGGNLSAPFTNLVSLTLSNRVINASSNTLSLSLTLSSGLFSGSATVPGTRQNVWFKGALLQNMDVGYGYFLGTNQSGSVYFGE